MKGDSLYRFNQEAYGEVNRILIVEDDEQIGRLVGRYLTQEGLQCIIAGDGKSALASFEAQGPFQLVVLDLMLPELSGLEVLRRIRSVSRVPVLILTAKDSEADKIIGLGSGADDYLAKPFSIFELTARAKALLRRYVEYAEEGDSRVQRETASAIVSGDVVIDPDACSVTRAGQRLPLTAKEFKIVELLASHPHKVFTRDNLYERIWGESYEGGDNTVSVHIRRLRAKLEEDPGNPKRIVTVWGMGYKWGEE